MNSSWGSRLAEIWNNIELDEDGLDGNGDTLAYHLLKIGAPASFLVAACGPFSVYEAINYTSEGFCDRVPELLAAGANPDFDGGGNTSLGLASSTAGIDTVLVLLNAGASPNFRASISGSTPLHSCHGNVDITRALLAAGADPNIQDRRGETALHLSAGRGGVEQTLLLMESGADPHIRNSSGKTAIEVAVDLENRGGVSNPALKALHLNNRLPASSSVIPRPRM